MSAAARTDSTLPQLAQRRVTCCRDHYTLFINVRASEPFVFFTTVKPSQSPGHATGDSELHVAVRVCARVGGRVVSKKSTTAFYLEVVQLRRPLPHVFHSKWDPPTNFCKTIPSAHYFRTHCGFRPLFRAGGQAARRPHFGTKFSRQPTTKSLAKF